jgi:hypothetical protein
MRRLYGGPISTIIAVWPHLSEQMRARILAMVQSAMNGQPRQPQP